MNSISKIVFAIVLAFAGLAPFAHAQEQRTQQPRATAKIPFEFLTLDTRFPAGQYSLSYIGPTHFFIRNEKQAVAAEVFTVPDEKLGADDKTARLIFVARDGKTYLVGIVAPDGSQRVSGLHGITPKDGDVRKEIALNY